MYVIKKFIKEKMNDRLFRALFLSAVVFALMASFSCPLSILRPFFAYLFQHLFILFPYGCHRSFKFANSERLR